MRIDQERPATQRPLPETLEALRNFDTCTVANAIERFRIRLRNEGFTSPGLRCVTGGFPTLLGYAATCKIRSSDPPMTGESYAERTDWWDAIGCLPVPRIAVIEQLESAPDVGSAVGEVHAAILKAFRCDGLVTNGAVRDLAGLLKLDFPVFARELAVSHSYTHLVEYGTPVKIFGLEIRSGDLILADCHGVVSIPLEIASELPEAAAAIREQEKRIVEVCRSPQFSVEALKSVLAEVR